MKRKLKTHLTSIPAGARAPGDIVLCNYKRKNADGEDFVPKILPAEDRFRHTVILGPAGCGKTSRSMLPMILQDIQNPKWGVTVLESKGDLALKAHLMALHFGRKSIYFDPTYENCPKFNPLAGKELYAAENMVAVFKAMNSDHLPFILDLNAHLIRNAVKVLKRLDKDEVTDGKYSTLLNLHHLIQNVDEQGRILINRFSKISACSEVEAAENKDIVRWFLNDYFPDESNIHEKTFLARDMMRKIMSDQYLKEVLNPDFEKGEKNEIDFDKHLADGNIICISTAQGALHGAAKYLEFFLTRALNLSIYNRSDTTPHALYIDDLITHSALGWSYIFENGTHYHTGIVYSVQSRAQIAINNDENLVEMISENTKNMIIYPGLDISDIQYCTLKLAFEKGVFADQVSFLSGDAPEAVEGAVLCSVLKNGTPQPPEIGFADPISEELSRELDKKASLGEHEKAAVKPGDIILCDTSNGKNVIWPKQDRFLHMLVVGPLGCGKTSKTILPMILQDIQNPEWGLTVFDPTGDLALKVHMMAKSLGRKSILFDPTYKNCPKFNPLSGNETDVIENVCATFRMLNPDSPQFFLDLNEQLLRNAIKVLKRLDKSEGADGKYATLIWLSRLLGNLGGQGRELVLNFSKISTNSKYEASENRDITQWFLNDYFPERSKIYGNTSGIRSQIAKLTSNVYLKDILNPDFEKGEKNEIDFAGLLANGGILCISTAQGQLRDLSKYLGYLFILSLQSSIARRSGTRQTRKPHSVYLDDFPTYSTPDFAYMLNQGRTHRVSYVLTAQSLAQIAISGGKNGKNLLELILSKIRNFVLYPGLSKKDAQYYAEQFANRCTVDELIYGAATGERSGAITYSIVRDNALLPAGTGYANCISDELNNKLEAMIKKYNSQYSRRNW